MIRCHYAYNEHTSGQGPPQAGEDRQRGPAPVSSQKLEIRFLPALLPFSPPQPSTKLDRTYPNLSEAVTFKTQEQNLVVVF